MEKIFKVGIVVKNVEESIEYYVSHFGMEVIERFPSKVEEDYVFLKSASIIIELMPSRAEKDQQIGFHHICFAVNDIKKTLEKLKDEGLESMSDPVYLKDSKIYLADINGLNEERIRLFEREKGENLE